jgi:uncharacterized protein (TIGR02452 family)
MNFPNPELDRITVWHQTKEAWKDFPEQESIVLEELPESWGRGTRVGDFQFVKSVPTEVIRKDCINAAIELKEQGYNPLLLNMADWAFAGGCVDVGSAAQEEELFRRSNYYRHLHQRYYPLRPLTTIVSKGVLFFREDATHGYVSSERTTPLDCVAAPAICFPLTRETERSENIIPISFSNTKKTEWSEERIVKQKNIELMKNKIRMLLYAAATNANDALVLSAWGCGAYGCPPGHIADLFKEVFAEGIPIPLRRITFAIRGLNYEPFAKRFS